MVIHKEAVDLAMAAALVLFEPLFRGYFKQIKGCTGESVQIVCYSNRDEQVTYSFCKEQHSPLYMWTLWF